MTDAIPTTAKIPADLLETWWTFAAKADDTTAGELGRKLDALRKAKPAEATAAFRFIAGELAKRPTPERCATSTLLAFWLISAKGFLQATAEVTLAGPAPGKAAEYLDPAKAKQPGQAADDLPPTKREAHRQLLEALDLAGADPQTVDLAELELRVEGVGGVGALRHLEQALDLVESFTTGRVPYSKARLAELLPTVQGTTQEHVVKQIGFRAAPTARAIKDVLDAQNDIAAEYWRTNFRDQLDKFLSQLPKPMTLTGDQYLVNSPLVLKKLETMLSPEALKGATITPLHGETGLSLLSGVAELDSVLKESGASPTPYQLYELLDVGKAAARPDLVLDTHAALAQLITGVPFSRLQAIAAGKNSLAPVCAMIVQLVVALTDGAGPARQDPLTGSALASLGRLIDVVVECVATPSVALRAVDLMMDEIGTVVAVAKNYLPSDYTAAVRTILLERAPGIRDLAGREIGVSSHLVCGGMDALATALWIALSTRGHRDVARPTGLVDYYETGDLLDNLKKGQSVVPREDVLVAALNPSTPFDRPDAAKLVADVVKGLQSRLKDAPPFALILDITIQVAPRAPGTSQLDVVLTGLREHIAKGHLEVFLCKSYQKYASFGFGKVAAGDLTLLSGNNSLDAQIKVLEQEIALGLHRNDESQLVVHLLKHGHQHELNLIRSAAENARFTDSFCWPTHDVRLLGSPYVDGIPLLLRSTPGDVNSSLKAFTLVDWRNSFSFLRTSFVGGIDLPFGPPGSDPVKYVRFNTGHESKAAMVEFFYAFGHLATGLLPGADLPKDKSLDLDALSLADVRRHLDTLAAVPLHAKADKSPPSELNRYRNNIIASYCVCASQLVRGRLPAKTPLLTTFFNQNTSGVTLDTQRLLAEYLLSLVKPATVGQDVTLIGALCRAAAVLPSAQFAPFAEQSNTAGLGTTDAAKRLKAIIDYTKKLKQ